MLIVEHQDDGEHPSQYPSIKLNGHGLNGNHGQSWGGAASDDDWEKGPLGKDWEAIGCC